jgi:hypothetical protein
MISIETMRHRATEMVGEEFPLVFWRGKGTIVAVDEATVDLLVRGVRYSYAWERVSASWQRLLANHTLTVDELGGAADAVGLASLFAFMQAGAVEVVDADGLLRARLPEERLPVHQYVDATRPVTWAPWRRKIHGA